MFQVNLLPWRQRRWRRRAALFALTLLLELLVAGVALGQWVALWRDERGDLGDRLVQCRRREQRAQEQRQRLQQPLAQHRRLAQDLRRCRAAAADNRRFSQLLEQLPALLPAGLWLTRLCQQNGAIVFSGCCVRDEDLITLSKRLTGDALFSRLQWQALGRGENGVFSFTFQIPWRPRAIGDAGE